MHELEVGDSFPIASIDPALALLQSFWFFLRTYVHEHLEEWHDDLWFKVDYCEFSKFCEQEIPIETAVSALFGPSPSKDEDVELDQAPSASPQSLGIECPFLQFLIPHLLRDLEVNHRYNEYSRVWTQLLTIPPMNGTRCPT
jgi:hypothetical protein